MTGRVPLRALRYGLFGVHGLTLERFAWTALAVVLFGLWSGGAYWLAQDGSPQETLTDLLRGYAWQYGTWLFPTMVAATLADNLPLRGPARTLALTAALLLGAVLNGLVMRHTACANRCDEVLAGAGALDFSSDVLWHFVYGASDRLPGCISSAVPIRR